MDHQTLKQAFPNTEIYQNHPLAPYTTVNLGGPADIFIHTKTTDEFIRILKFISPTIPTILGNGSNVLISDSGIRGIVIKNSANSIEFLPNNQIKVTSGVVLPLLLQKTADLDLSGLEEFAYIPSSVGGAIICNIHGVDKSNFDKFITSIDIFDLNTGTLKASPHSDISWSYDYSSLLDQKDLVVVSALLQLLPGNSDISKQKINDIITKKSQTQSMNSLGCVFKNPDNDSAGRIIDQELKLKGFRLGDVQISEKHANFFLNLGHATAADYLTLIKKVQSEAKSKLNLTLDPEIKFLGEF
jgi:UDP-N-acetylmuramate dehydrogenase